MSNSSVTFQLLLTLHFIGLALGLGGAFVADYSFFRSVRQADRISPETVTWMRSFSRMVWAGLALLAISGVGLVSMNPTHYLHSTGFLFKMFLVLILIVNGLFLNFYSTARLTTFNFSQKYQVRDAAWKVRKISFIVGAISSTTWMSIVAVAMFKGLVDLTFIEFLIVYLIALGVAIGFSLFLEAVLFVRAQSHPPLQDLNKIPLNHLSSFSSHMYKQQMGGRSLDLGTAEGREVTKS